MRLTLLIDVLEQLKLFADKVPILQKTFYYSNNLILTMNKEEKEILEKDWFSSEKPVKKDVLKSENFNIVRVYLKKDQEIKPHPEPYAVFFLVLEGKGLFTSKEGKFELKKNDGLFIEVNEIRGIKCLENLVILGIQDGH